MVNISRMLRRLASRVNDRLLKGCPDAQCALRKKMLFFVFFTSLILIIPAFFLIARNGAPSVHLFFFLIRAIITVVVLVVLFAREDCSLRFTEISMIALGLLVSIIADFRTYRASDTWAYAIVIMDLLLLCGCRTYAVNTMRVLVYLYLVATFILAVSEVDVYDYLPELSATERWIDTRSRSNHMWSFFNRIMTFSLDFLLTRHFALGMIQEQQRMEQSIRLAERITQAMVRFDLDAAEASLAEAEQGGLPAILFLLLNNLRQYRPYLPDALFAEHEAPVESVRAPPEGNVTIVFTDIVGSTEMWDTRPSAMRKVMAEHNRVVRECLVQNLGYEVKTIGDAFMVAFDCVIDGCRFALDVQEGLLNADWPDDITDLPVCCSKKGLWHGPRVRIGVNCGNVEMVLNPTTGRGDYLGNVVNVAARLERCAWSGTIAVSNEVLKAVGIPGLRDLGNPEIKPLGVKGLKGISEGVQVSLMVPKTLRDRFTSKQLSDKGKDMSKSGDEHSRSSSISSGSGGAGSSGNAVFSAVPSFHQQMKMRKSKGTVVHVRVEYAFFTGESNIFETVNDITCATLDSIGRTNGVLLSVSSSSMVATWNVSKGCPSHSSQSARFASLLRSCMKESNYSMGVTVGINTGGVLHGSVGSVQQQHMVAVGQCMELAGGLAAAASDLGTFALVGAAAGHKSIADDVSNRKASRQVDMWKLGGFDMDVFELNVDALTRWGVSENSAWGWSTEYTVAYKQRDYATILAHAEADDDDVLRRIGTMLKSDSHLRWPFPVSIVVR